HHARVGPDVPDRPGRDADLVEGDGRALEEVPDELRLHDDSGPEAGQEGARALEDLDVATRVAEDERSRQAADRAADDGHTRHPAHRRARARRGATRPTGSGRPSRGALRRWR